MSQTQNMLSACPHPRGKKWDNGMLPDFRNFRVVLISFFQITQNLKTLDICGFLQVVDIFILYKLKKSLNQQLFFSLRYIPFSSQKTGTFLNFSQKTTHKFLSNYLTDLKLCSLERGDQNLSTNIYFTFFVTIIFGIIIAQMC